MRRCIIKLAWLTLALNTPGRSLWYLAKMLDVFVMLTKLVVCLVYLLLRLVWTVLGAKDSQTLEVKEELHKVP